MSRIEELRSRYNETVEALERAADALDQADASVDFEPLISAADEARSAADAAKEALGRAEAVERARAEHKPVATIEPDNKRAHAVKVGREEPTYRSDAGPSFFADLVAARGGAVDALDRLHRNNREFFTEKRAISQTATAGGEFVAPIWMNSDYAELLRAGRPVVDAIGTKPLPGGTNSLNLPKITTGNTVAAQSDAGAVSNTDLVTTSVTAQVQTVAGRTIASYQLVDMGSPAMDGVIYSDLVAAYAAQFDTLVINGSATNAKGLLNVTGVNAVTFTSGSPVPVSATVANSFWHQHIFGKNAIEKNAFVGPDFGILHPSEWNWFLSGLDSQLRPLALTQTGVNHLGETNLAAQGFAGNIGGIPVVVSANVPVNLGGGTNQSPYIQVARRGFDIWESTPVFKIADQTSIANLQYQFVLYGYYAVASRQPKMISVVNGTGMIVQSGF